MKSPRTSTVPTSKANRQESKTSISNAPLSGAARYFNRGRFDYPKFFDETFPIMGSANDGSLCRDLNGRLFVFHRWMDPDEKYSLREITYIEACTWVVQNKQRHPPDKFLAFHGIYAPRSRPRMLPRCAKRLN